MHFIIKKAIELGWERVWIAMSHRGRMDVLKIIMGK